MHRAPLRGVFTSHTTGRTYLAWNEGLEGGFGGRGRLGRSNTEIGVRWVSGILENGRPANPTERDQTLEPLTNAVFRLRHSGSTPETGLF